MTFTQSCARDGPARSHTCSWVCVCVCVAVWMTPGLVINASVHYSNAQSPKGRERTLRLNHFAAHAHHHQHTRCARADYAFILWNVCGCLRVRRLRALARCGCSIEVRARALIARCTCPLEYTRTRAALLRHNIVDWYARLASATGNDIDMDGAVI